MSFYDFGSWGYLSALALISWAPVTAYLFRKHPPTRAATLSLLHAMMWLPQSAGFDLPAIPPMDKPAISVLAVLAFGYLRARKRVRAARLGSAMDLAVVVLLIGTTGTVLTNGDPIQHGVVYLQPMVPYDGLSFAVRDLVAWWFPVLAGRIFIRSAEDMRVVLRLMMVAGLIYVVPILYEIRMSPMLHVNVYGFNPNSDWMQNVRQDGYRATVFLGHGLAVGFFMCLCTLATITLYASRVLRRYRGVPIGAVVAFLVGIMVIQKATAALIYVVFGLVLALLMSERMRLSICVLLAAVVFAFPMLRMTGTFPTDDVVEFAAKNFGAERAQSLEFRFDNEDALLAKAQDRATFGFGGFGRERIYNPWTGKNDTVSDGAWVIMYTQRGVWGFLPFFALHLLPVVYLWRRLKRIRSKQDRAMLSGVAVILTVCAVDMLPNGEFRNLPLFLAGGLFTVVGELSRAPRAARTERVAPAPTMQANASDPHAA